MLKIKKKNKFKFNLWKKKYFKNKYIIETKKKNIYSRSWFKIKEIQKKFKIFDLINVNILNLGAYPGGWLQYLIKIKKNQKNFIISCDILIIKKIIYNNFIQGNILKFNIFKKLLYKLNNKKINIIASDISPNITGISEIDNIKFILIIKKIIYMCFFLLKKRGILLMKIFQGKKIEIYIKKLKYIFKEIKIIKTKASWYNSKEIFIIAIYYKKNILI